MEDRQCIILCNFNDKERKLLKSYGMMLGLRDQINVSWKNSNTVVRDIINENIKEDSDTGRQDKAIIFNNIPDLKVSMFIDNMKKMRLAPAMKAVVTETSIDWTLNSLLEHLVEERIAAKNGKVAKH